MSLTLLKASNLDQVRREKMNWRVKGGALRIRVVQKQKKNLVYKKINGFDICFRFVTEWFKKQNMNRKNETSQNSQHPVARVFTWAVSK